MTFGAQEESKTTTSLEKEPIRKRGRPRKQTNVKVTLEPSNEPTQTRKRGRPSKNKQPNERKTGLKTRLYSTSESSILQELSENEDNEAQYAAIQPNPALFLHNTNSPQLPREAPEKSDNNAYSSINYTDILDQPDIQQQTTNMKIQPNLPDFEVIPSQLNDQMWGNISFKALKENIDNIYEEIVCFRRNLFNVPSGRVGKSFITELTFWLKQFNSSSTLNSIAQKAYMVLPSLILQKPSAKSKSKDHSNAIERRLVLWKQGELDQLIKEVSLIQRKLRDSMKAKSVGEISKAFSNLVMQGKLSAALKFLDNEASSGVLPISPEMMEELRSKHPPAAEIIEETLLHGPLDSHPACIYDQIDESMIYTAALKTKGSAGPSGMDADLYRRILCSKNFNSEGKQLREEIATMTRNLLRTSYHPALLEAYTACRLIPLDKDPGIRPIGIGEVLRRIIGKTVSAFFKEEIREEAGPLQVCAGHNSGAEAAIHAMSEIFNEEDTDGILLIDASNAFNTMNRSVALHNIQFTCKYIALYLVNTYRSPSRLFVQGGGEIWSKEGTTQGDPLAMPWYAVNTLSMINILRENMPSVKQVWFADDSAGAGQIASLHVWYEILSKEGGKYGYHVNGSKSWLIVKTQELARESDSLFLGKVNVTTEGKRHLGAVIGSKLFKDQYCQEKVSKWEEELKLLSEIAKSHPHSAYIAYTKGYKSKFNYYMRTIESFEDYIDPVQDVLRDFLLPTLFGQDERLPDTLQEIITLTPAQGGLGITNLKEESPQQYTASKTITAYHIESIVHQSTSLPESADELKKQQQAMRKTIVDNKIEYIDRQLPPELQPLIHQARDKGASSWLNALPFKDEGFALNKQEFRDSMRLRYHLPLVGLPTNCTCGSAFSVHHALSCKKGGFISERHDGIRNLLTTVLSKVCNNVESEPKLIPIDNEHFDLRTANTSQEARLDIKAGGFWSKRVTAFFDVRITHVNSKTNQNKSTTTVFKEHENEKKRKYEQRILNVEMGTFTPLVFGTNGGMGKDCQMFIKTLAIKLANKSGDDYSRTITWLRTRLSFELLRSSILCIRGTRTPFHSCNTEDINLVLNNANIPLIS